MDRVYGITIHPITLKPCIVVGCRPSHGYWVYCTIGCRLQGIGPFMVVGCRVSGCGVQGVSPCMVVGCVVEGCRVNGCGVQGVEHVEPAAPI